MKIPVRLLLLLLSACATRKPYIVDQKTYDALLLGTLTQLEVRQRIGHGPYRTDYTTHGQTDVYGISEYHPLPVPHQTCVVWLFEYDTAGILRNKSMNQDCSRAGK